MTQKYDLDSNKAAVGSSECCAWPLSPPTVFTLVVRVTIRHRFHPITISHFLCLHPVMQSIKTLSPSAVFLAVICCSTHLYPFTTSTRMLTIFKQTQ